MKATTQNVVRISGKALGELALPSCCPRCFWLKLRMGHRLPFQIWPGIFASIDSYSKKVVHAWFDRHGSAPPWLDGLGPLTGYREPPHHSRFNIVVDEYGILLTGVPDGLLVKADRSHLIADYKTARYTKTQDELFPMYEVQLNSYALIAEACGYGPVSSLALVYTEPVTELSKVEADPHRRNGFAMEFTAHIVPVPLDADLVTVLLARVRELHNLPSPPRGAPGCKDCNFLGQLFSASRGPIEDA